MNTDVVMLFRGYCHYMGTTLWYNHGLTSAFVSGIW